MDRFIPTKIRGLEVPSTNFNQSRTGMRTLAFYQEIDLSVLRTVTGTGANAPLIINCAGNSFYADADPAYGNFRVRFQDTNLDRAPTDLYVAPGAIFNLPFTQILISNAAQLGKVAKIVYGVDIDFQPGSVSQVSFAGNVTVQSPVYSSSGIVAIVAGSNTLLLPGSNLTGYLIGELVANVRLGATPATPCSILLKSSAPAAYNDGVVVGVIPNIGASGATDLYNFVLPSPINIAAGLGVYVWSSGATNTPSAASFLGSPV